MNQELIARIKEKALEDHVPIMEDESLEYVVNFLKENHITSLLEIGTAVGYSSIVFASENPNMFITTIEINQDRYNQALKNIYEAGLSQRIKAILANARQYQIDDKFDVLFLDGPKAHNQSLLENYEKNLNDNGIIIIDDVYFHGFIDHPETLNTKRLEPLVKKFKKFRDDMLINPKYDSEYLQLGDGLLICRKKGSK